jgi:hypothetical protein
MARLPGYRSDLTFEVDQGPAASLSGWKNQLRWYGRLRSLVQHKMAPPLLMPLLAEDAETRLAQQCLSLFFPEQYKEQPATTPKTLQPHLKMPSRVTLPIPSIRTSRQEGPSLVQRSRNDRKSAVSPKSSEPETPQSEDNRAIINGNWALRSTLKAMYQSRS